MADKQNHFLLPEYSQVKNEFAKLFNTKIGDFYDKEYSAAAGKVVIDILAFDEWIETKRNGREGSMTDLVKVLFGDKANDLLNKLLP